MHAPSGPSDHPMRGSEVITVEVVPEQLWESDHPMRGWEVDENPEYGEEMVVRSPHEGLGVDRAYRQVSDFGAVRSPHEGLGRRKLHFDHDAGAPRQITS